MQEVVIVLEAIISFEPIDINIYDSNEKKELKEYNSNSNSSKGTIEINGELINDIESLKIESDDTSSLSNQLTKPSVDDISVYNNDLIDDITPLNILMETENGSSSLSNKVTELSANDTRVYKNQLLLELEENGFITQEEKAEALLEKDLNKPKYLYVLKLLFENLQNKFSSGFLRDTLNTLANPTEFDYHNQTETLLELRLRTCMAVLERICFTEVILSKEFHNRIYNSLLKFAKIHRNMQKGITVEFDTSKDDAIIENRNYNIYFLLIHLRDTLNSLRDDETWFKDVTRKTKVSLKYFTAGILSTAKVSLSNDNNLILSQFTQTRKDLNFKYPVPSYHVDWRIMLLIQHNLFTWTDIDEKFRELVFMEYIWSFVEKEWIDVTDKPILNSQARFEEVLNKITNNVLKDTRNFLNALADNEPLALPHTMWFGILDLAQNLIQKSTRKATYGLCYYLAIESLNKAPSSFIQFKAIEVLLNLYNVNKELFLVIEIDLEQYIQKLFESNLKIDSLEKFQNLLAFVKDKFSEDLKFLSNDIGKGKKGNGKLNQSLEQASNSNILDIIAEEIACPIDSEPTDQLCILRCKHMLSLNNFKKLKQKKCPICREKIDDNYIRYLPQNTIYKNLYSQFLESGHILPSIELEDSDQIHYDSDDSNSSEIDIMLAKKEKAMSDTISLQSIILRISKKRRPIYQNIIRELYKKDYERTLYYCKEYLKSPESYTILCILAYIYGYLDNYEQAHLYLNEAIDLKPKNSFAHFICGEVFFRQNKCKSAINSLKISIDYGAKTNNIYILLGDSYLFEAKLCNNSNDKNNYYLAALDNYSIALQTKPNNYSCLKKCLYIYKKQKKYLDSLEILNKLVNINKNDSLILCYYGEILCKISQYDNAILYFTKANKIDPENVHNLNRRAIAYYILQEYDNTLLDLNKAIFLDSLNSLTYYYKGLIYYTKRNVCDAIVAFEKCIEIDPNDNLAKIQLYYMNYLLNKERSKDLNYDIITIVNQIPNIGDDKSLLLIRCKIYIELEKYDKALLDFNRLFELNCEDISFIYLLQKYPDYWSYLTSYYKISDNDYRDIGIIENFKKYMYKVKKVYFLSNISNILLKSDINSLSGKSFDAKDIQLNLELPKLSLPYIKSKYLYIVWKICVKTGLSKDTTLNFIVEMGVEPGLFYSLSDQHQKKEHRLKYDELSKLIGLGWIEYTVPINIESNKFDWIQPSITTYEHFIDMVYLLFHISDNLLYFKVVYNFPNYSYFFNW
ncbi:hypothetical protein RclHR1_00710015 [Rhizophagus clarus]|uniref:Uncharacterized protein n=1 Tax=Rhizophagus clarus TaxID=94130 RepID=A0A2Z6RVP5_9GLOM|nr:hypothetical protein RclHR1_00710015 [Rhizophagus clarus]